MKNFKFVFLLLSLNIILISSAFAKTDTAWVRRYDSGGNDSDYVRALAVDNSGNVYVTGSKYHNLGHDYDYSTIKYSPSGSQLWARSYNGTGGNSNDYATAIALRADTAYVTGYSSNGSNYDYLTIKYEPNGDTAWLRRYNGTDNLDDVVNAIAVDGSGNVYVTGGSSDALNNYDYLTVKYNSSGVQVWVKRSDGQENKEDIARAIALRGDTVYVTGWSFSTPTGYDYLTYKYDPVGANPPLWSKTYNYYSNGEDRPSAIAIDGSGNVYVTGGSYASGTLMDYATVKYRATDGNQLWTGTTGRYNGPNSNSDDFANAIAVDGSGNVYVTGKSAGLGTDYDYATIKYNTSGTQLWTSLYGSTGAARYDGPGNSTDIANAIAVNGSYVYVTGASIGSGTNYDYATVKYNSSNGLQLWDVRYDGSSNGNDQTVALAVRADTVYVAGSSDGTSLDYVTIKYRVVKDVGVTSIVQPTGTIDSVATIIPRDSVRNYGSEIETFKAIFMIDSVGGRIYTDSQTVSNLPPDSTRRISFTAWTVGKRGNYTTRCSTYLASDEVRSNDTLRGSFTIRVHDYAATSITSPTSPVDSGTTITPKAIVYNYGSVLETNVPVVFYIVGTGYTSTKNISLSSGASTEVSFNPFTVNIPRATYTMRCTTRLGTDIVPSNNLVTGSFSIRVMDYAAGSITTPTSPSDSNSIITPKAWIYNNGTTDETSVLVTLDIPDIGYSNTEAVSLLAGASIEQTFDPCTLNVPRGLYTIRCTTQLNGDMKEINNLSTSSFTLRVRDYAVTSITTPANPVDSGSTITPTAWIHNYGSANEADSVKFYIVGTSYTNTRYVVLSAGDSVEQNFGPFTLNLPRNTYTMRCTTRMNGDLVVSNNAVSRSLIAQVRDFAATLITSPTSLADSGSTIAPKTWIHNYGTTNEADSVKFYIVGTSYVSTKYVSLYAGDSIEQNFDPFTLNIPRNTYTMRCTTCLTGDLVPNNNLTFRSFILTVHDYAVSRITAPTSPVDSGSVIIPKAWIRNNGTVSENDSVRFYIDGTIYQSTKHVNLNAGDSIEQSFDPFTLNVPRNTYSMRCTTRLTNDMVSENNFKISPMTVRVVDFAATLITSPTSPVDSNTTITPKAWIHNFGSIPRNNIPVTFYIVGTGYTSTKPVSLAAGDSVEQTFDGFSVNIPRNTYTMRCTTQLAGDIVPGNNKATGSFDVRVRDYAATLITSPVSPVDSGATITPKAWIYNYGTTDEADSVTFYIVGTSYTSTKYVSLYAGTSIEQSFDPFVFDVPLNNYIMRCTTKLNGDMREDNNLAFGSFTMRMKDYAVTSITSPFRTVDSTTTITPKAWIHNYGTYDGVDVPVIFYIVGTAYVDTQEVSLIAGDSIEQVFNSFTAHLPRGSYVMRCTTELASDARANNNLLVDSFRLLVYDVSVTEIIQPAGITDSAATISPRVRVKNNGTQDETFYATFTIGTWLSTKEVTVLPPNEEDVVTFNPWPVGLRGDYTTKCSTELNTDLVHSNDKLEGSFSIIVRDFGISSITSPAIIDSGTTIIPKAWIYNYGSTDETNVPVAFTIIGTSYNCIRYIPLNSGDSIEQDFDNFIVDLPSGVYPVRCTTQLLGDMVSTNNLTFGSIMVVVPGWRGLDNIYVVSRGVKDGGSMTVINDTIYAFQGANTRNFFAYRVFDDTWVTRCTIPLVPKPGSSRFVNKKVKAGGALTVNNRIIYAFKGNNTREFWSYYPDRDSWFQKAYIKEYATGSTKSTKVKAGGSLVACADSIYAFKGGNTQEFWVYDINQDTWYQRKSLIAYDGTKLKKIKGGAALTVKGCTLFAFIGGSTNLFYSYIIGQDTWIKLADASFGGYATFRKKIKDGASLAQIDGKIYALKGGNTTDFGCYDIISNTWTIKENIPSLFRVKAGGALAYAGNQIFAFIGGNSNQFWKYTFSVSPLVQAQSLPNTQSEDKYINLSVNKFSFDVSPNPFTKFATIHYVVPISSKVKIKLYNITGRIVETLLDEFQNAGAYSLEIRNGKLEIAKGVYFLKYQDNINQKEIKLVIN
jgi:hypothetical protein